MKQLKRWLVLALAAVMVLGCTVPAFAAGDKSPVGLNAPESVQPGEGLALDITASAADVVADGKLTVTYDAEKLTYVGVEAGSAWNEPAQVVFSANAGTAGKVVLAFASRDYAKAGTIFTLRFRAAEVGTAAFAIAGGNITGAEGTPAAEEETLVRKLYTVAFDAGEHGTFADGAKTASVEVADGTAIGAQMPAVEVEAGYVLVAWKSTNGIAIYTPDALPQLVVTKDRSFEAIYAKRVYTLSFDAGEHGAFADGSETLTLEVNDGETLEGRTPTVTPDATYAFLGWKDTNGDLYTVEALSKLPITKAEHFEAVYEGITHPVIFNTGELGAYADGSKTVTVEIADADAIGAQLPTVQPVEGYVLAGWRNTADDAVYTTAAMQKLTVTKALTFEAVYEKSVHTVTFNAGENGTLDDGTKTLTLTVTYGTALGKQIPAVETAKGYAFLGWRNTADSSVTASVNLKNLVVTKDLTFEAAYKDISHTVIFDAGLHGVFTDGSVMATVVTYEDETLAGKLPEVKVAEGYALVGWRNIDDGKVYTAEEVQKLTATATLTFEAVYEDIVPPYIYDIVFTAGSHGTFADGTDKATVQVTEGGTLLGKLPAVKARGGFTLDGWKDTESGKVYKAEELSALDITKSMVLTAVYSGECDGGKDCPTADYTDLSYTGEYHAAIDFVVENGYMNGVAEHVFAPKAEMTRAMMVTILYRVSGSPAHSGKCRFTDVQKGDYFYDAVVWALDNGITNGTSDTTFTPDAPVTREQFVTFLYRYAKFTGMEVEDTASLKNYSDVRDIQSYAVKAFRWAVGSGIIKGTDENTLSPQGTATREQFALVLYRLLSEND